MLVRVFRLEGKGAALASAVEQQVAERQRRREADAARAPIAAPRPDYVHVHAHAVLPLHAVMQADAVVGVVPGAPRTRATQDGPRKDEQADDREENGRVAAQRACCSSMAFRSSSLANSAAQLDAAM